MKRKDFILVHKWYTNWYTGANWYTDVMFSASGNAIPGRCAIRCIAFPTVLTAGTAKLG